MGGANKAYSEAITRKLRPFLTKYNAGKPLDLEKVNEINIECFVDHCLLRWENITDREGKPLLFTKENAIKLLLDLPELYTALSEQAGDVESFREVEEIAGKS
jgi:acyl carrier protein phosphodiesterase